MSQDPVRVLHVIGNMNLGGAESMIINIYRKIDRSKFQFDFLVSVKQECFYENEIKELGGAVCHTVTKSTQPLKFCKDLWNLIKKNKYSIVHVHASNAMAIIPILVAKLAGVKKRIVHSHTSNDNVNRRLHYVMRSVLNATLTDKFSCSDLASQWMYGKKKGEARIINNSIDCQLFKHNENVREKMRRGMGLNNETTYVHVGRFGEEKNHSFLIDIFDEIHKRNPSSVLLLIGTGELQSEIAMKVLNLNLKESIRFMGMRSDVGNILQACDAFLFPSLFEGLPLTVIEAQAAGLKCYVSDAITMQVKVTDSIKMISLAKSASEWAEIILNDIDKFVDKVQCNKLVHDLFDSKYVATQFMNDYYILKK